MTARPHIYLYDPESGRNVRHVAMRKIFRTHLMIPHGREADSAGWAVRREERGAVVPHKRRVTPQHARRVASRTGFSARNTLLQGLPMTVGIGRGSRLVSEPVRPKRGS